MDELQLTFGETEALRRQGCSLASDLSAIELSDLHSEMTAGRIPMACTGLRALRVSGILFRFVEGRGSVDELSRISLTWHQGKCVLISYLGEL